MRIDRRCTQAQGRVWWFSRRLVHGDGSGGSHLHGERIERCRVRYRSTHDSQPLHGQCRSFSFFIMVSLQDWDRSRHAFSPTPALCSAAVQAVYGSSASSVEETNRVWRPRPHNKRHHVARSSGTPLECQYERNIRYSLIPHIS